MRPAPVVRGDRLSGFTLIEIMVAMALLSIVFIAVFTLFSQTVRTEEANRFYTLAPMLAQKKMAAAVTAPAVGLSHSSGEFEHYPEYQWQITIARAAPDVFGSAVGAMKQIEVTVTAVENNRRFQLRRYELPE